MKKLIFGAMALSACIAMNAADSTPLWLRNVAISPDGKTIAFTYKGDVYTVPSAGGMARQLTSNPAYDSYPVWSPDGKYLAFRATVMVRRMFSLSAQPVEQPVDLPPAQQPKSLPRGLTIQPFFS